MTCWGDNRWKQAGDSDIRILPPTTLPALSPIDGLTAGNIHACVLSEDNIVCWGSDYSGQLGSGTQGEQGAGLLPRSRYRRGRYPKISTPPGLPPVPTLKPTWCAGVPMTRGSHRRTHPATHGRPPGRLMVTGTPFRRTQLCALRFSPPETGTDTYRTCAPAW